MPEPVPGIEDMRGAGEYEADEFAVDTNELHLPYSVWSETLGVAWQRVGEPV